jgi:hypothetical protein
MGSCEDGNEPSGSIKGGEFLDYLSGFLKKDCVAWSWLVVHTYEGVSKSVRTESITKYKLIFGTTR